MPIVTIQQLAGRSEAQKEEFDRLITEAVHQVNGRKPIDVHAISHEIPGNCWRQGASCCDHATDRAPRDERPSHADRAG